MAYEHIKKLLKEKGKTQEDLAAVIGRTQAVVANLFEGRRSLQIEEVDLLAKYFGVTADFIIYGKETRPAADINEADIALLYMIKAMIKLLLKQKTLSAKELEETIAPGADLYRLHRLPVAEKIMDDLRTFVKGGSPQAEKEVLHRLLEIAPLGSA